MFHFLPKKKELCWKKWKDEESILYSSFSK